MRHHLALLSFVTIILMLLPAGATAAMPIAGDPLTVGIQSEPTGLDPALYDFSDNRFQITTQIVETLVFAAPSDSSPIPGLAQSWSVSADGLTWTFNLRTGVTFHDGTPLDAAAVVFNLQRQWDPAHPYHNGTFDYFDVLFGGFKDDPNCLITDIAASGPAQVQITLRRPFSPLPSILNAPWLAIASPTAVVVGTMNNHPVGTGPFRFSAWTPGDAIRLEANAGYWRAAPKISPLTLKIIPDATDRLNALKTNAIQVNADTPADQIPAASADPTLRTTFRLANGVGYLGINRSAGPLANPQVRQAIAHALNKPALISSHYPATARLATQFVPPSLWGRDPTISDYDHDAALARTLLTSAGYPTGFSTTLAIRNVPRGYLPDPVATANAIKADLAAAGIQVEVKVYESGDFLDKVDNGELDLFLLGWFADFPHPANFLNDVVCRSWKSFGPYDAALCNALVRAEAATAFADQIAEYQWASRHVHETLPLIPLVHVGSVRVDRREIMGVRASPLGWDDFTTAVYAEAWVYLPLITR